MGALRHLGRFFRRGRGGFLPIGSGVPVNVFAALGFAAAVAAVNVGVTWAAERWVRRSPGREVPVQLAGFSIRFLILFAAAQGLWTANRRPGAVVVFIIAAAVLQTIGQSWIALKKQ